jgi:glycosyltransferase involved in cell wall biosynthesis
LVNSSAGDFSQPLIVPLDDFCSGEPTGPKKGFIIKTLPLVSVIIPAHNSSAYLADALRSALQQDYDNKEIIVVDDGSTDSTPRVLSSFKDEITILRQANAGPGAARNRALKHANGHYIAFLDADDYWLPGKLRLQIAHLQEHREIGAVYSKWVRWCPDEDGKFSYPSLTDQIRSAAIVPQNSGWIYTDLLLECHLLTSAVMLRRGVTEQVGVFDEQLLRGQDYDYWLRLSRVTQIHKLDRELVLYRIHGDNIAGKYPNQNYELMIVEKSVARWGLSGSDGKAVPKKQLERHLSELCFSFGYWHCKRGTYRIAREAFWKALHYKPNHWKNWIYFALAALRNMVASRRRQPSAVEVVS